MIIPPEQVTGVFRVATIIVSVAFLLAGIAQPQAAEVLLRLLLAALALGFVLARAYQAMLPARMTQDFYSPFDGSDPDRAPPAAPDALRTLTAELRAADTPRLAERTPIPRRIRWRVMDEAARRLADNHDLDLREPSHHAAIRALVSEPTWLLIGAPDPESPARADSAPAASAGPPVGQLPLILDDLERL